MIIGSVSYAGLVLEADPRDIEAMKDLNKIVEILNRNKVLVGGYDTEEHPPELHDINGVLTLDLGR